MPLTTVTSISQPSELNNLSLFFIINIHFTIDQQFVIPEKNISSNFFYMEEMSLADKVNKIFLEIYEWGMFYV